MRCATSQGDRTARVTRIAQRLHFLAPYASLLTLVALVAIAAVLRLYRIDAESIWLDEAFSIATARDSIAAVFTDTANDFHPPLYFLLLHGWFLVVDASPATARALSALISVALVAATFATTRTLAGARAGLLAALLVTLSTFHVEFAQEARMYALLALLSTVSTLQLIRMATAARDEVTAGRTPPLITRRWCVYVISTVLLVYTHAYAAFVLIAHAIVVLDAWRRNTRARRFAEQWFVAQLAVATAFLPWLPIFAVQFRVVQHGFWIPEPGWADVWTTLLTYAGSRAHLFVLALLCAVGWWRASPLKEAGLSTRLLLLSWLAIPILAPFLISKAASPVFLSKYTIAGSIPFAILAGMGLDRLPRSARLPLVAMVLALSAVALRDYYGTRHKDDWRGVVREVEGHARRGDHVVFYPGVTEIPWSIYRTRADMVMRPFPKHAAELTTPTLLTMLDGLAAGAPRSWLVVMSYDARQPALVARFRARFARVERHDRGFIDVYVGSEPK